MPKFTFDAAAGVYRFEKSGRVVPQAQVDALVDKASQFATSKLQHLAESYAKGKISLPEWVTQSTDIIKASHQAGAMIGAGGRDRMGAREWGHVGGRVRAELDYFRAFANEVDGLRRADLPAGFASRAGSYGHSVYMTHAESLARRHEKDGTATMEENELDAGSAHCDGCLEATAQGQVPIGTLTPIGERECGSRCRCRIVYLAAA